MKKKIFIGINLFLILLFIIAFFSLKFAISFFGYQPLEEVFFHMSVPMEGTSQELIDKFLSNGIYLSLIIFGVILIFIIVTEILFKKKNIILKLKNKNIKILPINISSKIITIIMIILILLVVLKACLFYKLFDYMANILTSSNFIEENYVDPKNVDVTLPENKRNLIYIYMESFESTYTSKENNGDFTDDLIPNLRTLAENNINFSNTSSFGGLYQVEGATWTIGAMVAQTAGVPLKVPIGGNDFTSKYSSFLGGAYTLGDILNKNGYKQEFLLGSDATFAGKDAFYSQHGNYDIVDYKKAIEKGYIASNYYEFWGYEDQKLYEIAKQELADLASNSQPFNLTMLTVDTHTYGGYLSSYCENKYSPQILSVISCEDIKMNDFINWIKEQSFYDNTTIVITGDHLNMDSTIFDNSANRKIYNTIINSAITTDYSKNRVATSLDMYPTILASLGANIPDNRLGLGVNLYSGEQTLAEKYGINYLNDQLSETSNYYNRNILKTNK